MFKKTLSIFLCLIMTVTLIPNIALAVEQPLPIHEDMETNTKVADIKSAVRSGTVDLTQDRVEGNYAVKVSANDEPGKTYVSYTLANSVSFEVYKYSQIKLWVKPGAGAKWIKFYTGSDVQILNDNNSDGIFNVGQDLISGKWNEIILDLTKTSSSLLATSNLSVQTNENSIWIYDEIISMNTLTSSVNISNMVNAQTELLNGELRFKKLNDYYRTIPTILTSQSFAFSKTDTSQNDFQQGTLLNAVSTPSGSVELSRNTSSDLCQGGTPISGGDYNTSTTFSN